MIEILPAGRYCNLCKENMRMKSETSLPMDNLKITEVEFENALLALDRLSAARLLNVTDGNTPLEHIENLLIPTLEKIGLGWEQGYYALSQVYMSGRICEEIVDDLMPPSDPDRKDQPKMAIAVLDDHHLLGKRMVYATLRASGYEIQDYGQMGVESLVQKTSEDGIEILLISVLMLNSALRVTKIREGLDYLGCNTRIIVGGAPFRIDEQLWKAVGADAMGKSASDAISAINCVSGGRS
jgi:methanogenic corrinoid protein MtbC1